MKKYEEYLELDKDGLLCILPCKIGATVYAVVHTQCESINSCNKHCEGYNYYCGDYLGKMKILEWKFEPCLIDRIGRNVFLSEEEALNYIKSKG